MVVFAGRRTLEASAFISGAQSSRPSTWAARRAEDSLREVSAGGVSGEHKALTRDDGVDKRQHGVDHLIAGGQAHRCRGEPSAGQVGIDPQPAVSVGKDRFHEQCHDAMITGPPRQHEDGPSGTFRFIVDGEISEITFHRLTAPLM